MQMPLFSDDKTKPPSGMSDADDSTSPSSDNINEFGMVDEPGDVVNVDAERNSEVRDVDKEQSYSTQNSSDIDNGRNNTELPLGDIASLLDAEPFRGLTISEKQQKQISLLESLLENEAAQLIPSRMHRQDKREQSLVRLAQVIIGILVFIGVILPVIRNHRQFPLPPISSDVVELQKSIASLKENDLVMVALDYEPAFVGEIEPIAKQILFSINERGTQIYTLSSEAGNVMMSERLMQYQEEDFRSAESHIQQLGLIPGGAVGLARLVSNPANLPQHNLNYTHPSGVGSMIQDINDLSMLIVFVSDPQTAKTWVEQVSSHLVGTPMFVITSAQSAPIVEVYANTIHLDNQSSIRGVLSGFYDEVVLMHLNGITNTIGPIWDAYQIGIIIAIIVLLASTLVGILRHIHDTGNTNTPARRNE